MPLIPEKVSGTKAEKNAQWMGQILRTRGSAKKTGRTITDVSASAPYNAISTATGGAAFQYDSTGGFMTSLWASSSKSAAAIDGVRK